MATYVITDACIDVKDATCVDVCPVACIHTTPDAPMYYIDPDVCIACEQCFIVCPVNAIYLDSDVPEHLRDYLEINAEFFRENKGEVKPLSLDQAKIVIDAIDAYSQGTAVAVVVVSASGERIAVGSADGAATEVLEQAENKAYSSALLQVATHQLARGAERPAIVMPEGFDEARMVVEPGGYPIMDGAEVIGAVGVAGSGSSQRDFQCCQAGLAALRAAG